MNSDPLKFAIIGCGRIINQHLSALRDLPDARLVAVCDLKEDRTTAVSEAEKVPGYLNYHEMLRSEDVDVVSIMTPSGMHPEHSLDVMRRYQKHIVVEKPMALRLTDATEMIATADEIGVQLHVVQQNRFNKAVQKIRSAIDGGAFGKIALGTVRLRWCRPQRYYDRDPWRGKWAFDGGALTNQAVHHIDLLQWLVGEVDEVSAYGATQLVKVEVEDTATAVLKFKNGAIGAIEATTAARPDDFEASVSIMGENGTVIAEGASVNRITTWTFDDGTDVSEFAEAPPTVYGFGHTPFLANVIASIRGTAEAAVSGREGIKPLRLLHAIYASIETGRAVKMADGPASRNLGNMAATMDSESIRRLYVTPEPK